MPEQVRDAVTRNTSWLTIPQLLARGLGAPRQTGDWHDYYVRFGAAIKRPPAAKMNPPAPEASKKPPSAPATKKKKKKKPLAPEAPTSKMNEQSVHDESGVVGQHDTRLTAERLHEGKPWGKHKEAEAPTQGSALYKLMGVKADPETGHSEAIVGRR